MDQTHKKEIIKQCIVALLLFAICFLTYGSALHLGLSLDDKKFLSTHHYQMMFGQFSEFFTKTDGQHYYPIYFLSNTFLFDHFGKNVFQIRLIHLSLFYLSCLTFYFLIYTISKNKKLALLTSTLLCVHPINFFTFHLVSANFIFIVSILMALSFICFWRQSEKTGGAPIAYSLSLLFYAMSLLAFEGAMLFPLYLASGLFFVKKWPVRKIGKSLIPYVLLIAGYLMIYRSVVGQNLSLLDKVATVDINIFQYLASFCKLVSWYIGNLFIPNSVVFMMTIEPVKTNPIAWIALLGGCIVCAFFLIGKFWKQDLRSFALSWFLIGLILVVPAIFAHSYMGLVIEPHWLYFSSMGIFLLGAIFMLQLYGIINQKLWIIMLLCLLGYWGNTTRGLTQIAKTEKSLNMYWLEQSPRNVIALTTIGWQLVKEKDYESAIPYFEKSLNYTNNIYYKAHLDIGVAYTYLKKHEKAKEHLYQAANLMPNPTSALNALGGIFIIEKDYERAEQFLLKAKEVNPYNLLPYDNLISLYELTNRYDNAIIIAQEFITKINDRNQHRLQEAKLVALNYKVGKKEKANKMAQEFIGQNENSEAMILLAKSFYDLDLRSKAMAIINEGMNKFPLDKEMYIIHGKMKANVYQFDEALEIWMRGQALDPKDARFVQYIEKVKMLQSKN